MINNSNKINIDPSKLSNYALILLKEATFRDMDRARKQLEELESFYNEILIEESNRMHPQ